MKLIIQHSWDVTSEDLCGDIRMACNSPEEYAEFIREAVTYLDCGDTWNDLVMEWCKELYKENNNAE